MSLKSKQRKQQISTDDRTRAVEFDTPTLLMHEEWEHEVYDETGTASNADVRYI